MASKYLICSIEVYEQGVRDAKGPIKYISKHKPIFNQYGTMVLVKGIGNMTSEEVIKYQSDNDWFPSNEYDSEVNNVSENITE